MVKINMSKDVFVISEHEITKSSVKSAAYIFSCEQKWSNLWAENLLTG